MCVHDKVVVELNAETEKYLNYETSANGIIIIIGYVGMRCHDSNEFSLFGLPRKFHCYRGEYARVVSPEKLVLKENANLKFLVDKEDQLLTDGKTLTVDRSYLVIDWH
jgi:hypothetical protein